MVDQGYNYFTYLYMIRFFFWFICCTRSVKSVFDSPQFKENLTSFQQLLSEGIFDISFSGAKAEDCKTLKRLALFNLSKCKWVERYKLLKVWASLKFVRGNFKVHMNAERITIYLLFPFLLQSHRRSPGGSNVYKPSAMVASNLVNVKRLRGGQNQNFQG